MHPRCDIFIAMGNTHFDAPRHAQHSQILVPRDTPGVTVVRNQTVFGSSNSPGGEAELLFDNVRVPKGYLILGEGRGFEIAQGRLGPGRILTACARSGRRSARSNIWRAARIAASHSARSSQTKAASDRTLRAASARSKWHGC